MYHKIIRFIIFICPENTCNSISLIFGSKLLHSLIDIILKNLGPTARSFWARAPVNFWHTLKKKKYFNTFKKAFNKCFTCTYYSRNYQKKYLGTWRLILEAGQIQVYRSHSNIPSCMSKCRFSMIRISILTSNQYITTWRLLVSDPGGWSAPSRGSDIIFDIKI